MRNRDRKKTIAILLVLLAIVTSGTYAAADVLPGIIRNIVTYVFGYALGGILLIKFGIDLATAIFRKDQDPTAIKKAIIGFVITLVVVLPFLVCLPSLQSFRLPILEEVSWGLKIHSALSFLFSKAG